MIEDLGGPAFVKRLEYGNDAGTHIRVEILGAKNADWVGKVIDSAMINHANLYPVNRLETKWRKDRPYWQMALLGVLCVVLVYAFFYFAIGIPPDVILNQPGFKEIFFMVMPAVFLPMCIGLFVLMEWQSRRFRRKSEKVAAQFR